LLHSERTERNVDVSYINVDVFTADGVSVIPRDIPCTLAVSDEPQFRGPMLHEHPMLKNSAFIEKRGSQTQVPCSQSAGSAIFAWGHGAKNCEIAEQGRSALEKTSNHFGRSDAKRLRTDKTIVQMCREPTQHQELGFH
jgi:hypothetical protein